MPQKTGAPLPAKPESPCTLQATGYPIESKQLQLPTEAFSWQPLRPPLQPLLLSCCSC